MRCCLSFLFGFNCIFQLYNVWFTVLKYGYRNHVWNHCVSCIQSQSTWLFLYAFLWFVCNYVILLILRYRVLFHHDGCDYHWHSIHFDLHIHIWAFWEYIFLVLQVPHSPLMFLPMDVLFEYWIEHVTFRLLYVMFRFPTRIFNRGVPGFATDCSSSVWCRG